MTFKKSILVHDSRQYLTHYSAGCFDCGASCGAKNAQAWAHQHVRKTGHRVELSLGWQVAVPVYR